MSASPLTSEQALALAPDSSVASAGQKLATERSWQGLGRDGRAAWGECKGSALYQVRVDLSDLATRCTCPSRKFPCKHASLADPEAQAKRTNERHTRGLEGRLHPLGDPS